MYWFTVSVSYLAGVLPYVWTRLFGYHMSTVNVHFALAAMWIITASAAFVRAGKGGVRRWLPFARRTVCFVAGGNHRLYISRLEAVRLWPMSAPR
jgi:hypothetical protein